MSTTIHTPHAAAKGAGFIRLYEVTQLTSLQRSTIYDMMAIGAFPRPIKIGKRSIAWVETEIIDWINTKIKTSRI
jgi:prophage regulatory protein